MPQQISPMIPRGATEINETTGVIRDDFEWRYFLGPYIFFKHAAGDQKGFRFATSSLIANGICRPVEIIKTFGVSKSSVNRYLRTIQDRRHLSSFTLFVRLHRSINHNIWI